MRFSRCLLRGADGFSLIEVLTTVSVLSVVGMVAATNFRAQVPAYRARGAALLLAGDLNQARLAAIKEGRFYQLLPLAGTSYQIRRDDGGGGLEVVKQVDIEREYRDSHFGIGAGIDADPYGNDPAGAAVPAGPIIFHSNGTVVNPAGLFVESGSGAHPAQQAVTVTAAGRVRIWRWDGSVWH